MREVRDKAMADGGLFCARFFPLVCGAPLCEALGVGHLAKEVHARRRSPFLTSATLLQLHLSASITQRHT
jgi:hypothetical protein